MIDKGTCSCVAQCEHAPKRNIQFALLGADSFLGPSAETF